MVDPVIFLEGNLLNLKIQYNLNYYLEGKDWKPKETTECFGGLFDWLHLVISLYCENFGLNICIYYKLGQL